MVSGHDRRVLRELASWKAEAAASPENTERRTAWYTHDTGSDGRPMILAEISGIRDPHRPVDASDLDCEGDWARSVERRLRCELYEYEVLRDDHVVEPWMQVNWHVTLGDYGVKAVVHSGDHDGKMGSFTWDPPIADIDRDYHLLTPQERTLDREATLAERALAEELFDGILPVRIRGNFYWTMGLTWKAIELVGLEGLMLAMYDNPDGLHRIMRFLCDQHLETASWLEREGLYSLNNENDYIGSGSMGYSRELGARCGDTRGGCDEQVRTSDLWVLSESQETVGVGPELFEEFIFPYQKEIVDRFGKSYYGCCEPVDARWHIVSRLGNLARVSVSPWSNEKLMADYLGSRYVFSRKPAPSEISTKRFDEQEIRSGLRHTLETAKNCRVELIMKDVHTLNNEPERLARWVALARDEVARSRG